MLYVFCYVVHLGHLGRVMQQRSGTLILNCTLATSYHMVILLT